MTQEKSIKYKNLLEEFITEEETKHLSSFSKLFYENGALKKEEVYRKQVLWGGIYVLEAEEKVEEVLPQLGTHLLWTIQMNPQVVNSYTLFESRVYNKDLSLKSKFYKTVKDQKDRTVATISFDTKTEQAISAFKTFHFGGEQVPYDEEGVFFEEDACLCFSFDDQGKIERINMDIMHVNNSENWTSVESFLHQAESWIEDMMTTEQLHYFTNVLPVVPNF